MQDIVILGAGGLAREVAFLIEEINRSCPTWRISGFVDFDKRSVGRQVGRYSVICSQDELVDRHTVAAIGIGTPSIIRSIAESFKSRANLVFPNLVHPGTIWDRDRVVLEVGNTICAGNVFTTDIRIGSFNYFNLNCTYGHDVQIGSYCVLNPGINLSGGVSIGDGCLIGTGATILQNVSIGAGATVGAGAVVTKDVKEGMTVIGIPARPISSGAR